MLHPFSIYSERAVVLVCRVAIVCFPLVYLFQEYLFFPPLFLFPISFCFSLFLFRSFVSRSSHVTFILTFSSIYLIVCSMLRSPSLLAFPRTCFLCVCVCVRVCIRVCVYVCVPVSCRVCMCVCGVCVTA